MPTTSIKIHSRNRNSCQSLGLPLNWGGCTFFMSKSFIWSSASRGGADDGGSAKPLGLASPTICTQARASSCGVSLSLAAASISADQGACRSLRLASCAPDAPAASRGLRLAPHRRLPPLASRGLRPGRPTTSGVLVHEHTASLPRSSK